MRIPGPQNARGQILRHGIEGGHQIREATIIDISDYHGQLIPLSETADNVTGAGAVNPAFNIGGSAFLKPWFDALPRRGRGGSADHRCRRLRRGDAADLQLLRRHAHDRVHEHDGLQRRRARQPQLRPRGGVSPEHADSAGQLRFRVGEHRRRPGPDAEPVEAVADLQPRTWHADRVDRLLERRSADAHPARCSGPVPRCELDGRRQRRSGPACDAARHRRGRGDRTSGSDGRNAGQPHRTAPRPRRQRLERRRGDRRSHRLPGGLVPAERRARDREPEQGTPVHARPARHRPARRHLHDRRLPQAVECRGHAGCGHSGSDRRVERGAGPAPGRPHGQLDRRRSHARTAAGTGTGGSASRRSATWSPTRCERRT